MNQTTFIILIIAIALVLVGSAMFLTALAAADWDITSLDSGRYESYTHDLAGEITDIAIGSERADVNLIPTEDGTTRVFCHQDKKERVSVELKDGVLLINGDDERKWYERLFSFTNPVIDVYIPSGEYASLAIVNNTGDIAIRKGFTFGSASISADTSEVVFLASVNESLDIELHTGDVEIENVKAKDVSINLSTGEVKIDNLECESFSSEGTTGDIELERITAEGAVYIQRSTGDVEMDIGSAHSVKVVTNTGSIELGSLTVEDLLRLEVSTGDVELEHVHCGTFETTGGTGRLNMSDVVADGNMNIERSTGDVRFDACDAATVQILTDTGDVVGSFLTDKIIFTHTDTGRVDVPECTSGGKCTITTETGKIIISIAN